MPFKKGVSGNPAGRPKGERALTAILEAEGNRTIEMSDGKKVARKRLMARYFWEAVTTGQITFPDGKVLVLSPDDILALAQFLYKHIDGPPIQNVDITTRGESIAIAAVSPEMLEKLRNE